MLSERFFGLLFFILLLPDNLFLTAVAADQIFTSSSGATFGRSSREPKYNVVFHSADSPFHPENDGQESVAMTNKEGQNYLCFLPIVEESKPVKPIVPQNSSSIIVESDRRVKVKTPDELLDILKDQCLYRHEGWWSYEFCYHGKVRQVHLEDDKAVQEFVLGVFDPEATTSYNQKHSDLSILKDPRSSVASQRYHAHQYTNGTVCDLTNQPRETEVRFFCSDHNVIISSIKEISSCKYVVTIQSPMLCNNPMFQLERRTWHIHCNEMPKGSVEVGPKETPITLVTEESENYAT
ncbi:protein OS-9 homolog [Typha angustifolia]|uniref:protein OS-9 homolog n=1 Tax=Typha angustifolia TaxID=59011 RepID=UPI003C2B1416